MKKFLFFGLIAATFVSCDDDEQVEKVDVANFNGWAINSIVVDKSNNKWIGTDSGLYKSVTGGYSHKDVGISGKILSLGYDATSSTLWVGTVGGLSKVSISGSTISATVVPSSNLSSNMVNAAYTDPAARVWLGTDIGVSMYKSGNYKKDGFMTNELSDINPFEFADAQINSITCWDGDYYFATTGMSVYRTYNYDATIDAFTGATQLGVGYNGMAIRDTMFAVFTDSKGRQWMGGTGGLQAHIGHDTKLLESYTNYYEELPDTFVHAIAEALDGKIWIGTRKGLAILNEETWTKRTDNLPDLYVTAIAFDIDGSAWIGTKKGLVNIK